MLLTFLNHQFVAFKRSRNRGASVAAHIVMALFVLYFLLMAISVGFLMDSLIQKLYPGSNSIEIFNGFIVYYFLIDFLLRVQFQELPTLSIQPYLHLNISKKKIVQFLNVRGLFSAFNVFPLLIFLPFILSKITIEYNGTTALFYAAGFMGIIGFANYFLLYLKRKSIARFSVLIAGVAVVATLGILEYFKIISLAAVGNTVLQFFIQYPALFLVFILLALLMIKINSSYLYANLYVEELESGQKIKGSTDYVFLNRFGKAGELAALELKLILRHKRSKSVLYMSFLFLAYGFFFYKPDVIKGDQFAVMLFAATFITGIFIIMYGQFMFAWQSKHFDGLLANKIDFRTFIRAKFLIFNISCIIVTLLSTAYAFMSWKLVVLHLAAFLYNIGIGSVIVLWFATKNYKRLDLSKGGSFNWQGTSAVQWIMSLPFLLFPYVIYAPFGIMDRPYWGLFAIALVGLIFLLMRNFWINFITKIFIKQRYKIAEGFRE